MLHYDSLVNIGSCDSWHADWSEIICLASDWQPTSVLVKIAEFSLEEAGHVVDKGNIAIMCFK